MLSCGHHQYSCWRSLKGIRLGAPGCCPKNAACVAFRAPNPLCAPVAACACKSGQVKYIQTGRRGVGFDAGPLLRGLAALMFADQKAGRLTVHPNRFGHLFRR